MHLLGINCNIYSGRPRVLFCLLRKLRNSYIAIASSFLLELYKQVALFYFLSGPPRGGEGNWALGPKRSIYFNRTIKYSIKAVTTYILSWVSQALSAALISIALSYSLKPQMNEYFLCSSNIQYIVHIPRTT